MSSDLDTITAYDRRSRLLHWSIAILVVFLWVMAKLNGLLPKGPLRLNIWSIHVLVGFALAGLVAWRVLWRFHPARQAPKPGRGPMELAALAVHAALYILMIAVVVLGVMNVFGHGFPLFGLWKFPRFWQKPFQHQIGDWHDLAANAIFIVAGVHAAAALVHQFILKDKVMLRMWPGRTQTKR